MELEPQLCLLHTWDNGKEDKLVGEVFPNKLTSEGNPVAQQIAKGQDSGLQHSALSPRIHTSGFSPEEGSSYSFFPVPFLLPVGPCPPSCLGSHSIVEPHHYLVPPLSLSMPHTPSPPPLPGTDSWSFGRAHLMAGKKHFLTEELRSFSGLFMSLKRKIEKNTSVSYYLRHSCEKFRSSASHSPSSAAPQFWNCLKCQMIVPVKFPRY